MGFLTSIMAEVGRPNADLLSLDVEGSEDAVLRTVDPLAFRMILVEFNAGFRAFRNRSLQAEAVRREEWVEQRLLRAGLTRCQKPRIFWSRLYARAAECPSALQHNATLETVDLSSNRVREYMLQTLAAMLRPSERMARHRKRAGIRLFDGSLPPELRSRLDQDSFAV